LLEASWPSAPEPSIIATFDTLADRVTSAVRRADLHEAEHRATLVFQRSVLPATPTTIEGLAVGACYEPADERFGAGGDWYDAVALDEHRLMVMIGDVVGHGIESAGVMGRLSTAARTLVRSGSRSPADVLRDLDDFVADNPEAFCSSMLCALLDVEQRRITYSSAGHLPPLVRDRNGATRFLTLPPGPVLGIAGRRTDAVASLDDIAEIVLYTDGLVGRDEALEDAIDRMAHALVHLGAPRSATRAQELVEQVMAGVLRHDDIAVLTVAVAPVGITTFALDFDPVATAPAAARHLVRSALEPSPLRALADDVELLTSELVSNAIEHARSAGRLVLELGPTVVRVEVADANPLPPTPRVAQPGDIGGRGLYLVDHLSTRWGVDHDRPSSGKTVWFELTTDRADATG
jgi:anti-sigma regulatory factor (Ser/Thr protein kinase)